MNFFRFQSPWWLLLIIPLVLVWYLRNRRNNSCVFVYSNVEALARMPVPIMTRVRKIVPWLFYFGLLLAIVALARPQWGQKDFRVRTEGIAIAVCLDRSGSMQAMDFFLDRKRVDRLTVVKQVFRDFILGNRKLSGRPDDLVSLIAFGGFVDAWCPLTLDHETLAQMLESIQCPTPLIDAQGNFIESKILEEESATAIGDSLMCAIERLEGSKAKSKVVLLLSDGVQNTGVVTAEEAAKIAAKSGIRVYTIGIGTSQPVPFPVYTRNGEKVYRPQILELDEQALRGIADETGGKYYHVSDTEALRAVCSEIDSLEKTTYEDRVFTRYNELYRLFLIPGLACIMLGLVLVQTRFRMLP